MRHRHGEPFLSLGLMLVCGLLGCSGRALGGDTEHLSGYLCSNQMVQAHPWVATEGERSCALDAYLSAAQDCQRPQDWLCSEELGELAADLPWGQAVTLDGRYEDAEICSIRRKDLTVPASCVAQQRFVPSAIAPR
jgi:hypothetical protein